MRKLEREKLSNARLIEILSTILMDVVSCVHSYQIVSQKALTKV